MKAGLLQQMLKHSRTWRSDPQLVYRDGVMYATDGIVALSYEEDGWPTGEWSAKVDVVEKAAPSEKLVHEKGRWSLGGQRVDEPLPFSFPFDEVHAYTVGARTVDAVAGIDAKYLVEVGRLFKAAGIKAVSIFDEGGMKRFVGSTKTCRLRVAVAGMRL